VLLPLSPAPIQHAVMITSTAASQMSVHALILLAQSVLNHFVTINMLLPQSVTLVLHSLVHNRTATKSRQSPILVKMPCRLALSVHPRQTLFLHQTIFNL
jgi:hypothetical protein